MSLHILKRTQILPVSVEEAWDFFSSPKNLNKITPEYMGFDISSPPEDDKAYEGMIITYKVRPVLNISLDWVTEITYIDEPHYFVDEQRFGPYRFWHHKHFFKEVEGGTLVEDIVHYKLPLGPLGKIAERLLVRKKLNEIFDYRSEALESIFPDK